jgi:hypothetical protein
MARYRNLARVSTATVGTGTITLGAAVSGYNTFANAGVADGEKVIYGIKDGANSEAGLGTYTSAGTTLSRDVVYSSTNSGSKITLSGTAEVYVTALAENIVPVDGYIYGLTLSNNGTDATNDIDIAVGAAGDSDGHTVMRLTTAITKRLDAAWAVGTGNGGLDTGSIADTTYHIWLIQRSDTGVTDALFSASASAPTMPTNYDRKRRIGSIIRASAAIRTFVQYDDRFWLNIPVQDVNATNPGTSAVTRTLTTPGGVKNTAMMTLVYSAPAAASARAYLSSLDMTDTAASTSAFNLWAPVGATGSASNVHVQTSTGSQIRSRVDASDGGSALIIATLGWIDTRGK